MNMNVWDPMTDPGDHVHLWRQCQDDFVRNVEVCGVCLCIRARQWWLDDIRVEVTPDPNHGAEGTMDESSIKFIVFRRDEPLPVPTLRPPAKVI